LSPIQLFLRAVGSASHRKCEQEDNYNQCDKDK
jgi:hypothetical protein